MRALRMSRRCLLTSRLQDALPHPCRDKAGASGRTTAANLGTTTPSTDVSVLPARAFTIQPAPSADSTGSRTHSAGDASAPSASGTPKGSGPDNTAAHGRKSAGRHPSKGAETGEGNWRVPSEKERPWDRPEDKSKLLVFYSDHYEVELPEGHRYPMQKYERAHRTLRGTPSLIGGAQQSALPSVREAGTCREAVRPGAAHHRPALDP
mmetsp:Transcript_11306/g.33995  ORF Transcript_11306/g.33995 Transcript_11306/m.33995 type:complete len:208 (+) Transcript_11306:598-1221(+)